jgi:hypothetical protein
MSDIMGILQASHSTGKVNVPSNTKYVAVDPKLYQGTWSGTYADKKKFTITVADISGFRAQAKYQSDDGTIKYQSVLIKDGSFRVGDTKFFLATAAVPAKPATAVTAATPAKAATATIKTVGTDPVTGSTFLDTATATQS